VSLMSSEVEVVSVSFDEPSDMVKVAQPSRTEGLKALRLVLVISDNA
jgi:hypothetical protein